MITVKDLIERLQFLIVNNLLNEDDLVLILGSGNKLTNFPINVVAPTIVVDTQSLLNDSGGCYAIGFMKNDCVGKDFMEKLNG